MAATLASFASILKEFYLGPIQDQLNEETLVCDMFEKASVDWNGRQVIIPVHTARNTSVGFRAETAALPGPVLGALGGAGTQQGYSNLTVNAAFLYGRFQITGPAMAAAGKGGANSFVGWVDGEMNRLVNDVKTSCNIAAVSGGTVIGFVASDTNIGAIGTDVVNYTGSQPRAAALDAAGGPDHVTVVRMDTYATTSVGTIAITATSVANGTVSLTTVAGGAVTFAGILDPTGGAVPMALVLSAAGAAIVGSAAEPMGIYGNLADPTHFGVNRATAGGVAPNVPTLQCGNGLGLSNIVIQGTAPAATNARDALNMAAIQGVLDRVTLASDGEIDVILCSPLQRTRLAAVLQGNFNFNTDKSGGGGKGVTADGGYTGFAFAGIPIKTSRHVDNGAMWFLSTKTWKMTELESGRFADEDGDVLSRVGVLDAYEGFYKWYYNVTCLRPNANAALLNLALQQRDEYGLSAWWGTVQRVLFLYMIEITLFILLIITCILGAQLNVYVLVITNLKREELIQKVSEQKEYITPTDSIQDWQWEGPQE